MTPSLFLPIRKVVYTHTPTPVRAHFTPVLKSRTHFCTADRYLIVETGNRQERGGREGAVSLRGSGKPAHTRSLTPSEVGGASTYPRANAPFQRTQNNQEAAHA